MRTRDSTLSFSLQTRCPLFPKLSALAREGTLSPTRMCQLHAPCLQQPSHLQEAGSTSLSPGREIRLTSSPTFNYQLEVFFSLIKLSGGL